VTTGRGAGLRQLSYWRARATGTQLVGQTDVIVTSEYSQVRSFKTPNVGFTSGNDVSLMEPVPGAGAASSSAVASATTTDRGVVAQPTNLVATASGSGVVLTWIGPRGATPVRYAISGGTAPHTSTLAVIVTADASNRYTIPALPPGSYYFTVFAILADGLSPPSDEAAVVASGSRSRRGLVSAHRASGIQHRRSRARRRCAVAGDARSARPAVM
jgi:hypothetical protein